MSGEVLKGSVGKLKSSSWKIVFYSWIGYYRVDLLYSLNDDDLILLFFHFLMNPI